MNEMITSYISQFSAGFFFRQLAVIVILFAFGFLINACLVRGNAGLFEVLYAFPVGLSAYSLISLMILITGIPFNRVSVTGICAVLALVCIIGLGKRGLSVGISLKEGLIYLITMLCIAVISCSGIISVCLSNDSLYYYSIYPRAMVTYGFLRPQFDVFLTDVGQGSAVINTLPFMYGFNEAFGIQIFLGINTLLIAIRAMYERAAGLGRNKALAVTGVLTAVLVCSQPYIVMSRWMMSNGYFMCYMLMVIYAAHADRGKKEAGRTGRLIITSLLMTQMSELRMEGIMVALILIICFFLLDYTNSELFWAFLMPEFIFALAYAFKVFIILTVDAPYTFLTPRKAMVQLGAIVLVSLYVILIRGGKFDFVGKNVKILLPAGLILANGLLFLTNKTLYLQNVIAFLKNISNRSGWGLFPMCLIGGYLLVFIVSFKGKKEGSEKSFMTYWDLYFVCYLLAALAVCFARDDALRESIGDSGNRVLMQGTLIAFMALADHIIGLIDSNKENGN